jgi:hypothetical protein
MTIAMLRGEQATSLRTMVDMYEGRISPSAISPSMGSTSVVLLRVFMADGDMQAMRARYDDLATIVANTPLDTINASRVWDQQRAPLWRDAGLLSRILMAPGGNVARRVAEVDVYAQVNNTAIAARRLYLRTSQLPKTLDELVSAGLMKEAPIDPFSGRSLLMKVHENEVVIYSVGADGLDNGGDDQRDDITFHVGTKPLWEIDRDNIPPDTDSQTGPLGPMGPLLH